jgi:hypothetical protein
MLTDSSYTIMEYSSDVESGTITGFYTAGDLVFAKGVVVRRASDDPAWSASGSTTSTTTTAQPSSSGGSSSSAPTGTDSGSRTDSGLSTGAKAGIGVGVALGVLIIMGAILAAFLIGRRRRRAAQAEAAPGYPVQQYGDPYTQSGEPGTTENKGDYMAVPPAELEEQRTTSELNAHHEPSEPVELMSN